MSDFCRRWVILQAVIRGLLGNSTDVKSDLDSADHGGDFVPGHNRSVSDSLQTAKEG